MKNSITNIAKFIMLLVLATGCQDDDHKFGSVTAPTNLEYTFQVVGQDGANPNGDGSGLVNLTVSADNALSYQFTFSDGASPAAAPQGTYQKRFTQNGTHTYTITAIAYGTGGASTSKSFQVTVFSNFSDPEVEQMLTGGSSKVWYWAAATAGHLGVGPTSDPEIWKTYVPNYYSAGPYEKAASPESSCLYENKLTFTMDGSFIRYQLDNGGKTFFNSSYNSVGGSTATTDQCLTFDTSAQKTVTLSPSSSGLPAEVSRQVDMIFSDNGFMGYYIGQTTYEILELTNSKMVVRAVMGNNPSLAWYHTFSTNPPYGGGDDPDYTNLLWQDEFNIDGAPDPLKWKYDLGGGGWGNNEVQNYTQSPNNVVVNNGTLKITARKEGSTYTSARIKTQDLFDFTYGKVEIRAKLAGGGGAWPALWMLGANYQTNPWPASGEIDIMEYVGNTPNKVLATLHMPGFSGGQGISGSTNVANAETEFHVYSVIWHPDSIKFYVDGVPFHSFVNSASTPFNADFFLIFNVAMGGNLGGTIDPGFTSGTMEVDYVKVYN